MDYETKFKSHYIRKHFFMQFFIKDNDVSAGKATESAILFIYGAIAFVLGSWDVKIAFWVRLQWDNQLKKYLRHCTVFWLKLPLHDLVVVTPSPLTHSPLNRP